MLTDILKLLCRKKTPVKFNDFERAEPLSRLFGSDRGTPIDRYYVESFLARNSEAINGRILEVGSDHYSRRFCGMTAVQRDILHVAEGFGAATIVGDLTRAETLPVEAYDCFICTQTLNFIYDLDKAISGAHQLLCPGGVMLASVAGISHISRYDMDRWGDYWRFTTASVQKMFAPVFGEDVQVESFGNVMATCAFLQGCAVEDLPEPSLLDRNDPDYQMLITVVARKGS